MVNFSFSVLDSRSALKLHSLLGRKRVRLLSSALVEAHPDVSLALAPASLIDAAATLSTEVLHHAHDNFYTMLMYAIQILFHVRSFSLSSRATLGCSGSRLTLTRRQLRNKIIDPFIISHTITTLHTLQPLMYSAGSSPPHKDGLAGLYAARLAKLLQAWEIERSGGEVGDLLEVQASNSVQQMGHDDLMTMGSDFLSLDSTYLNFFEQPPAEVGFDGTWIPTMQW